jgi:hypothetical protein
MSGNVAALDRSQAAEYSAHGCDRGRSLGMLDDRSHAGQSSLWLMMGQSSV